MALATVDDVKRWLKDPSIEDEDLAPWLEVAEEKVRDITGRFFGAADAEQLETFTNVREGSIITLSEQDPQDVAVMVFGSVDSDGMALEADAGFQMLARGRVQLLANRYSTDLGLGGGEGVTERHLGYWSRVEVTYTSSGLVPASVREATACIAAHLYKTSAQETSGLDSERLGDYSYTRAGSRSDAATSAAADIPAAAKMLLSGRGKTGICST
jgi:hypothetical protein